MPKNIYEEAISDVRQLKKIAEEKAIKNLVESVEPKIKAFIDKQLFESTEDEDSLDEQEMDESSGAGAVQGMSLPLGTKPEEMTDEEYELDEESTKQLQSVSEASGTYSDDKFEVSVYQLEEEALGLVTSKREKMNNTEFLSNIEEKIQVCEHMYVYLRESYAAKKADLLESKLERSFKLLNSIKETTEKMKMRDLLKEDEMTVKISGLPDGVELEDLNVDLISDEPGESADSAADGGAEATDDMATDDTAGVGDGTDEVVPEGEDEVLEISESELRSELARIRGLKEAEMSSSVLDDFGDADKEGTPMEDDFGLDELDEAEDKDEKKAHWKTKMDEAEMGTGKEEKDECMESKKRLGEARARYLRSKGKIWESAARNSYRKALKSYSAAKTLAESKKKSSQRDTNVAELTRRLAESRKAVQALRVELAQSNLLNAKLIHVNRFMRADLTESQMKNVADRLDEAKNLREVRLVSESLKKTLAVGKKGSLSESTKRAPVGSSSRVLASSSTVQKDVLSEGVDEDTDRWAILAGIK